MAERDGVGTSIEHCRDKWLADMRKVAGLKPETPIPEVLTRVFRDELARRLEEIENVSSRDSIRIAHAWMRDDPTPTNWRLK